MNELKSRPRATPGSVEVLQEFRSDATVNWGLVRALTAHSPDAPSEREDREMRLVRSNGRLEVVAR